MQRRTSGPVHLATKTNRITSFTYIYAKREPVNIINPSENVAELTRLNPFDRLPDGRPCVPDDLLERMKTVTSEQAWAILDKEGYLFQFEGNWFRTHPDRILVGRAVTAQMMPYRPDLHNVVQERG